MLHLSSRLGITSREQHEDHQDTYDARKVRELLERSGFSPDAVETGRFELGLNLWARAAKS